MYTIPAGMLTDNGIFKRFMSAILIAASMMCICCMHTSIVCSILHQQFRQQVQAQSTRVLTHKVIANAHRKWYSSWMIQNDIACFQNHLLEVDAKKAAGPTWETVRYMVSEIQYGGRITDDFDQLLMDTYAEKYFHQEVTRPNFELYKDERAGISYKIPDSGEIEGFRKVAEAFTNMTLIIYVTAVC